MTEPQHEFRLGIVGVVEGGRTTCQGCGFALPPGSPYCPVCGFERRKYAGREYPKGRLQRYQWLFDQDLPNPTAKWVLTALVHFDRADGEIFPSMRRLAEMTGLSERAVRKALRWLEAAGWIKHERRRHKGRQTSNTYTIHQAEADTRILAARRAY